MNAPVPKRIVIVGSGISGLAAAFRIQELSREKKQPVEITIVEGSERPGGVIETDRFNHYLLEGGAESFLIEKPQALDLCRRLGLENEILPTNVSNRKSFILRRGRLRRVPDGFYLIAPLKASSYLFSDLVSFPAKLRSLLEPWVPAKENDSDESVAAFIRRRFGKRLFTEVGQAMIGGIYSADAESLSLQAAFPQFLEMERQYGSVIQGLKSRAKNSSGLGRASGPRYSLFVTLTQGLSLLIRTLIAQMPEVQFHYGSPVTEIAGRGEDWEVRLQGGMNFCADQLCLAVPAYVSASLLSGVFPELSRELDGIPYESAATVNLIYRQADVQRPLKGFGCVIPPGEKRPILGLTVVSNKFQGRSPKETVLLRAFVGGKALKNVYDLDDESLSRTVSAEVEALLGINGRPLLRQVKRYPRSMPQYHLGHNEKIRQIETLTAAERGLYLLGNAYEGVGIPDCIRRAERIAAVIMSEPAPKKDLERTHEG